MRIAHQRRGNTARGLARELRSVFLVLAATALATMALIYNGPWGSPIPATSAYARIAALALLVAAPPLVLALRWRRVSRRIRIAIAVAVGTLTVLVAMLAMLFAPILLERARLTDNPRARAEAAFARGDRRFLGYDAAGRVVPGVENVCLHDRHGVRLVRGMGDETFGAAHRDFVFTVREHALTYNRVLATRMGLSSNELSRPAGGYCPPE